MFPRGEKEGQVPVYEEVRAETVFIIAETATKATRQIPVVEIAALVEGTKNVPVEGGIPGFYYTLEGSESLEGLGR